MFNLHEYRNMKLDIKKLEKENRYYDLFSKYPSYDKYRKAMNYESIVETGKKYNGLSFKIRNLFVYKDINELRRIKYNLASVVLTGILATSALSESFVLRNNNITKENIDIINEYDENLEEYASKFNTDEMSDMEIIMTVMKDIRSNTEYGINEDVEDIGNNFRLTLDDSNNIGVCRHMADKFTAIMNMINPEYEAYNLLVNLNTSCNTFVACNIDTPVHIDSNEESNTTTVEYENTIEEKIFGNHMVSILKPINKNYYLVVDVTNPSIGVLKNGKIYMFNTNDYSFIEYRPLHEKVVVSRESFDGVCHDMLLSNFEDIDIDELNKLYGLEEQNKILTKIK